MRVQSCARRGSLGLAAVALFALVNVNASRAEIGAVDLVPAATLLLPYFEVEVPGEPNRTVDTVLTVMNASPAPAIAHLVLWTDYGVPTYSQDIFLTGFDVETISLAALLDDGGTAVIAAHRGRASALFGGLCAGFDHGDALARGYVTVDNANEESKLFPPDPEYFEFDGSGVASNINQLWGQYIAADPRRGVFVGGALVHVEAAPQDSTLPVTFYARDTNFGSADQRERLPSSWGTRYWNGLSDLICWRDDVRLDPFTCPNQSAAPLTARGSVEIAPLELVVFDHAENAEVPAVAVEPCRLAAGRVRVGSALLPVSAKTGWIFANVNPQNGSALAPRGFIIPPPQAYFSSQHTVHPGGLAVGVGGVGLDGVADGLGTSTGSGDR